ncbi:MAG: hypothetical protein IJJ48_01230 [Firmicutes bacterium]|nr:hypothetical protein [Bacillota bacterium]
MDKKNTLSVRFLGGFSVTYNGHNVMESQHSVSQFSMLMQLVLYYRKKGVSRSLVKDVLFGDRDVNDAQHAIRNIIYNSKKRLKDSGLPSADYIVIKKGSYFWTDEIPVDSDTEELERLKDLAAEEEDSSKKLEILLDAIHKYTGEFLLNKSSHPWTVRETIKFRDDFSSCVSDAAEIMREKHMSKELLALGEYASKVDPYAEWEVLSVEALSAMSRFKEAEDLCDKTVALYINEHGQRDPMYVRDLANRLSAGMVHNYADIDKIQKDLAPPWARQKGGFFCSYPVFQEVYRTLSRMMERHADRFYLILCTIIDSKGNIMEAGPKLDELSPRLQEAILTSIRHSDTVTKYGKGQYLVLLTNTSREDCEIVRRRIDKNFLTPNQRTGVDYQINTAIITPDVGNTF